MAFERPAWVSFCSETRTYRLRGWEFSLSRSAKGTASLSCPLNRGDLPVEPKQAEWIAEALRGRAGVKQVWDGAFEFAASLLEDIECEVFSNATGLHRRFINHDVSHVPELIELRCRNAEREAHSLSRNPDGVYFGLSVNRTGDDASVYGVWAIQQEPTDYGPSRRRLFEAFPTLEPYPQIHEAVGPQRPISISRDVFEAVVAAFADVPLNDFAYLTASWDHPA